MLWRSGHDPRKHHVRSQALQQLGSHSRHTVEPRQAAERTMLLAPRDDSLGEGRPDSGETRDFRHVGAIEVDALAGKERSREPGGLPRGGGEPSGGRSIHGHESHVAGRRGLGGSERQSHTRAGEGEQGEQEGGAAVVHARTLTARPPARVVRSTRVSPKDCGLRERGRRNAEGGTQKRSLVPDARSWVPRSAFRIPRFYRTRATATSPTTCSDAALTLSMVSSVVCQYG